MTSKSSAPRKENLSEAKRRLLEQRLAGKAAGEKKTAYCSTRPVDRPLCVSPLQEPLLTAQLMDPSSSVNNLVSAYRFDTPPKIEGLETHVNTLVAQQKIYRTNYRMTSSGFEPVVHDMRPVSIDHRKTDEVTLQSAAAEWARQPFDLANDLLLRVGLFTSEAGKGLLLVVMHHAIADEWSMRLFWQRPDKDESTTIQYEDVAAFEQTRQHSAARDYWTSQLKDSPPEPVWPRAREETPSPPGCLVSRTVGPEHRIQTRDTSPMSAYLAALSLLVQRYTSAEEFVVGLPVSTRNHPDLEIMHGYFLNLLPVRLRSADIGEVHQTVLDGLQHRDWPFAEMIKAIPSARNSGSHPLFNLVFVYQPQPEPIPWDDGVLTPEFLDMGTSRFGLTLFVTESENSLMLSAEFQTDRFSRKFVNHLLADYEKILTAFNRETPAADVILGEPVEGPELTIDDRTVMDRIIERARQHPHAPALVGGDGYTMSYEELLRAARATANAIRNHPSGPQSRVGLYMERSPHAIVGLLGTLLAGAAYVPLDPDYPESRQKFVIEDADLQLLLVDSDRTPSPFSSSCKEIALPLDATEDDEPGLPDGTNPAYIIYTSGSTGRPRGVEISHRNLAYSTKARDVVYGEKPERFALLPSLSFDSSVAGLFRTLVHGGVLLLPGRDQLRDPKLLVDFMADHDADSLLCIPSWYEQL
ncbi:MAG: AMP-binding protein, partial [Verrucomicrobiota bacterium]